MNTTQERYDATISDAFKRYNAAKAYYESYGDQETVQKHTLGLELAAFELRNGIVLANAQGE